MREILQTPLPTGTCTRQEAPSFAWRTEYLVDHHRVFDAGDDFDRTATLGAGFYVDIAYRDVGKGREQDAEALNTRFSR